MWRYTMEDLDALWQPLADVAIEQGCDVVRIDNVEEVQRVVAKQGRLMAQMKAELKDEVEAQTLGASSFMGWNLVKFKEGSGLFGNPMVPIQAKDVRLWEHHYAQRSRDETTARAGMAGCAMLEWVRGGEVRCRGGVRVLGTAARTGRWQVICQVRVARGEFLVYGFWVFYVFV